MPTDYLDPNGTHGSIGVTAVGAAGEPLLHETIDEGMRQPAEPDVSAYCDFADGGSVELAMGSREVAAVSEIKLWVHYSLTGAEGEGASLSVTYDTSGEELWANDVLEVATHAGATTAAGWASATFSGLNATQSELDALLIRVAASVGPGCSCRVHAVYAEITYTGGAAASRSPAVLIACGLGTGLGGPTPVF